MNSTQPLYDFAKIPTEFLKFGAKRRTSKDLARKNPCGARNSVCLLVCVSVIGQGFRYRAVELPDLMFLGVVGHGEQEKVGRKFCTRGGGQMAGNTGWVPKSFALA